MPWEIGLAETQQTLVLNDLRSRIWVQTDGQLKTGRDVVIAALLGADEMGFATAPLIATGCVMMRACHLNTCPVGIATQDPELRKRFRGQPEHVIEFFFLVAEDVRRIMASLGVARFEDLVGRVDLLEPDDALEHWQARGIDLSNLLRAPDVPAGTALRRVEAQVSPLGGALDWQLIDAAAAGARRRRAGERPPSPSATSTGRSAACSRTRSRSATAAPGLPPGTIRFALDGSAGQSFGAWLAPGIELTLTGEANDYAGKGLSGGTIVVRPPPEATFAAEQNVIVGNTVLYGATAGRAFFRGIAGERFAVRNSGASAVVEGVGDHALRVHDRRARRRARPDGPELRGRDERRDRVRPRRGRRLRRALQPRSSSASRRSTTTTARSCSRCVAEHAERTGSPVAARVLADWNPARFVKVIPHDYKRALADLGDEVQYHDHPVSAGGAGLRHQESEEAA